MPRRPSDRTLARPLMPIPWTHTTALARCIRGNLAHLRYARNVAEVPVGVAPGPRQRVVAGGESGALERLGLREAVHADDAAVLRGDEAPFALAGDRVGVHPAQVALGHRIALVLEQVLELLRKTLRGARGALVVGADRLPVLVADEEQLLLLLALHRVRGELAVRRHPRAEDRDQDERTGEREALLPATSAHSLSRRCARRTRRPCSGPSAARRPRCSAIG